jgi:hypothetical protein
MRGVTLVACITLRVQQQVHVLRIWIFLVEAIQVQRVVKCFPTCKLLHGGSTGTEITFGQAKSTVVINNQNPAAAEKWLNNNGQ